MREKVLSKKTIIVMCAAAAAAIVAAAVMLLSGKDEFFRSIMVYELEGRAVIERADIGSIDAAENLYLESGDCVSVEEESMMRMKLDDDKYITAEANTIFSLEAKGDGQDSETRILLEQGAITSEIQNPLSKNSLYETVTPNSVMAVRGTVYRAELYDDGEGGQDMRLCCFKGTVAAAPLLSDGTLGEEVLVNGGSELTVYSDGAVGELKDIDFDTLPEQAVWMLSSLIDNGTEIAGTTKDELLGILSSYEGNVADAQKGDLAGLSGIAENAQEASTEDMADADDNAEDANNPNGSDNAKKEAGRQTENKRPTGKNTGNDGNSADNDTEQKSTVSEPEKTPDNSGNEGSGSGDSNRGGEPQDKPGSSGNKPKKPAKSETYTVTYKYQDAVFASQTVKKGDKASVPTLAPAAEGAWDFDFDTKIQADTVIEWK